MTKKLIIFDLDNTLFKSKESYKLILGEVLESRWGIDKDLAVRSMIEADEEMAGDNSYESIEDFYDQYNRNLLKRILGEYDESKLEKFKEIVLEMKKCVPTKLKTYSGVTEVLRELKGKGYKIAILTGTWDKKIKSFSNENYAKEKRNTIVKLLDNSGLKEYIDELFVTYDKAIVKPHPESFNMVLRHFAVDPEDVVMVGDKEADILSSNVGITSVLFDPKKKYSGDTKPHHVFDDYTQLIDIIEGL